MRNLVLARPDRRQVLAGEGRQLRLGRGNLLVPHNLVPALALLCLARLLGLTLGQLDALDERLGLALHRIVVDIAAAREDVDDRVVDLAVRLMTLDILVPVLCGRDGDDDDEREDDQTGRDGRELGEELEDGDT